MRCTFDAHLDVGLAERQTPLVFGRFCTYVSFCKLLNLSKKFFASGVGFVEKLLRGGALETGRLKFIASWRRLAIFIIHAMSLLLAHKLTSFIHVLYPSWVSFDPSHFADVIRSLEVVEGIFGRRRCARAKLVVQLREGYRRLITRWIVAFNFSPRNLTQVTSAMKTGQGAMIDFASVKRVTLCEGLY